MSEVTFQQVRDAAQLLENAGVGFWVRVDAIGCTRQFQLLAADVELYLRDRHSWTATQWGVTPGDLSEWDLQKGTPLCGGLTKAGKPCRSRLTSQIDPPGFVNWHRQYLCHAHSEQ